MLSEFGCLVTLWVKTNSCTFIFVDEICIRSILFFKEVVFCIIFRINSFIRICIRILSGGEFISVKVVAREYLMEIFVLDGTGDLVFRRGLIRLHVAGLRRRFS